MSTPKERGILFSGAMVRALLAGKKTQTRRAVKPSVKGCTVGTYTSGDRVTPVNVEEDGDPWTDIRCPYGHPGDRLWVRETWSNMGLGVYPCPRAWYRADFNRFDDPRASESTHERDCTGNRSDCWACERERHGAFQWRPSLLMPRWASRLTLAVESIRVERAQDISDADIEAEGVDAEAAGALWRNATKKRRDEVWALWPKVAGCNPVYNPIPPKDYWGAAWTLINGRASWDANPWVWVVSFRRLQ